MGDFDFRPRPSIPQSMLRRLGVRRLYARCRTSRRIRDRNVLMPFLSSLLLFCGFCFCSLAHSQTSIFALVPPFLNPCCGAWGFEDFTPESVDMATTEVPVTRA